MKVLGISPSLNQTPEEREAAKEKKIALLGILRSVNNDRNEECHEFPGLSEILPSLYLCGAIAARAAWMERLGIDLVVNATKELPDTPLPDKEPIFLRIPVVDSKETNLAGYFDQVADLIESIRRSGGKSLVHCVVGVSRSASLVLAYLIKYQNMSLLEAFNHVKKIRPQIRPNNGFFVQLIEYEKKLRGTATVKMVHCRALKQDYPEVFELEYRGLEHIYEQFKNRSRS